jgi:4-oxalmesaconate hydratase
LRIDIHAHYTTPPPQLDAFRGRQLMEVNRPRKGSLDISDDELDRSLQVHLKRMRDLGIDREMFSPRAFGMGHSFGTEIISRYWTEVNNDLIARVCQRYPDKFVPVCQLPQSPGVSPANCIPELERCVNELGFVGCNINPDVAGGNQPFTAALGDKWWYPLWEKLVELDVPAMIHGTSTCDPARHLNGSHYIMIDVMAAFELCWSNIFEDFPTLKIIVPHGGGAVPYQWNRHRSLHVGNHKRPFEEVVKHLYFDTAVYDRDSMEMLIRKMGVDNVLFATEPFGTAMFVDPQTGKSFDDTVSFVDDLAWLSESDRSKIFEGNARRLFSRAKL